MQLEHISIIYNHQQNPPMYIYTNPHNYDIPNFTNAQIHQVTYSLMPRLINYSNPMSQVCIHQIHLSSSNHHSHVNN